MKNIKHLNEFTLLKKIKTELPNNLGSNFIIKTEENLGQARPDFVIENIKTGKKIVIELKGSKAYEDLPLAVVPTLRILKQSLGLNFDNFILVSLSNVSNMLKDYLTEDNIKVVEVDENDVYIKKLVEIILSEEKK